MNNQKGRYPGLDGLRGVAILLVLIYHIVDEVGIRAPIQNAPFLGLFYAGNTGVTLFFVLSGFLVGRPIIEAVTRNSLNLSYLKNYGAQRATRILPPYYVLGFIGVFATAQPDKILPMLLFFLNGYDLGSYSTVWWSLQTEVGFYVALPLIAITLQNRFAYVIGSAWVIIIFWLYILFVSKLILTNDFNLSLELLFFLPGQLPAFAGGLAVAYLYPRLKSLHINYIQSTGFIVLLIYVLSFSLESSTQSKAIQYMAKNPWYVLPEALIWSMVVMIVLASKPRPSDLIENSITRYFGKISYSLYLVHMPILKLLITFAINKMLFIIAAFTICIAVAQLSYWLVERPSLRLKNTLAIGLGGNKNTR